MTKNIHYANQISTRPYWAFDMPVKSESVDSHFEEVLELVSDCYSCFGNFLTPREIYTKVMGFDREVSIQESQREPHSNAIGISLDAGTVGYNVFSSIVEGLDENAYPHKRLSTIHFSKTAVEMEFPDGEHTVSRRSEKFKSPEGDKVTEKTPLELRFGFGLEAPTPYQWLSVKTNTDIWFADTDVGRRNRKNLGAFLHRIYDTFDVDEAEFRSDGYYTNPFEFD